MMLSIHLDHRTAEILRQASEDMDRPIGAIAEEAVKEMAGDIAKSRTKPVPPEFEPCKAHRWRSMADLSRKCDGAYPIFSECQRCGERKWRPGEEPEA